jgi:sugar lactone lactonase YvrE
MQTVRRIDAATGEITTVVGTGEEGYTGDGGPATEATLHLPTSLGFDAQGRLLIADTFNHVVRRINSDGTIQTVAGTGAEGFSGDGGKATEAHLSQPSDLAVDSGGNIILSDSGNSRLRRIDAQGNITTIARSSAAQGIAVAPDGSIYVADTGASRVRLLSCP